MCRKVFSICSLVSYMYLTLGKIDKKCQLCAQNGTWTYFKYVIFNHKGTFTLLKGERGISLIITTTQYKSTFNFTRTHLKRRLQGFFPSPLPKPRGQLSLISCSFFAKFGWNFALCKLITFNPMINEFRLICDRILQVRIRSELIDLLRDFLSRITLHCLHYIILVNIWN